MLTISGIVYCYYSDYSVLTPLKLCLMSLVSYSQSTLRLKHHVTFISSRCV